jgi:hypothetical protein
VGAVGTPANADQDEREEWQREAAQRAIVP